MKLLTIFLLVIAFSLNGAEPFNGFQNAVWGMSPDDVKKNNSPQSWNALPPDNGFPKELNVKIFNASQNIVGQQAAVKYYFMDDKFFQATIKFNFDRLKTFDFNFNVYRSVDSYYRAIREQTLTFVFDIFDLLRKKYGKKEPSFKGVDPRFMFAMTDEYLKKEAWNLRSYPYEYYKKINTSAYAQWQLPKTDITFSVAINAPDKQFDYLLSLSSISLSQAVNAKKDSLRLQNL